MRMKSIKIERREILKRNKKRRKEYKKKGKRKTWKELGNKKTLSYLEEENQLRDQIK